MAHEAGKQLATMQKMSPRFGSGSVYSEAPFRHALSCQRQHTLSAVWPIPNLVQRRVAHTKSSATSIPSDVGKQMKVCLVDDVSEDQTRNEREQRFSDPLKKL